MRMGATICCTALLTLGLTAGGTAGAAMYKWTDAQGNVQYSQEPPPDNQYQEVAPPPPPPSGTNADEQLNKYRDTITPAPPPTGEMDNQKLQAEVDQKNCEAARKNLDTYTRYRRVKNAEGEIQTLGDDERKAKIKESQEAIDKYCK